MIIDVTPVHVANVTDKVIANDKESEFASLQDQIKVESTESVSDSTNTDLTDLNDSLNDLLQSSKVHLDSHQSISLHDILPKKQTCLFYTWIFM